MLRFIKCLQILFAAPLLAGSLILAVRLLLGGGGRIGGDSIFELYVLAGLNLVTMTLAFFLERGRKRSVIDSLAHCASLLGVILWLSLHPSGLIYSHESLFLFKQQDMEESLRLLRELDKADRQDQTPKQN